MKKNVFLGLDGAGKHCCLLYSHLAFDQIRDNIGEVEADDFSHDCTNWSGCDLVDRTLAMRHLKETGRVVHLLENLIYYGEDHDMGHSDRWVFSVSKIVEVEPK